MKKLLLASLITLAASNAYAGEFVQIVNDNCEDSSRYIGSDQSGNYYLLETYSWVSNGDWFVGDFRSYGFEDTFNMETADEVSFYIEEWYASERDAVEFCFD